MNTTFPVQGSVQEIYVMAEIFDVTLGIFYSDEVCFEVGVEGSYEQDSGGYMEPASAELDLRLELTRDRLAALGQCWLDEGDDLLILVEDVFNKVQQEVEDRVWEDPERYSIG